MNILNLVLKKKWFDMIASGEKKEEYREIKPYWTTRLRNKRFTYVRFRLGYSKDASEITLKFKEIYACYPIKGWCEKQDEEKLCYAIKLGEKCQTKNLKSIIPKN